MNSFKKYLAEFIGTCVLVLFACGTAVISGCSVANPAAYLMTALAFGLVIVAMAYSIGNISGCHINPAVSIAMLVNGKMTFKDFIGYIVAQFAGGIAGAALLMCFVGNANLGQNNLVAAEIAASGCLSSPILFSILIEVILTFVFVMAIMGVTSKESNAPTTGLVIGLTLTLVHLLGIPFTGTSVNPARSFGPALFAADTSALANVWVFIVAPLVGGVLAALVYKFLASKKGEKAE